MVALTFVFIVMLVWVVRVCKQDDPNTSISKMTRKVLYLVTNIAILAIIPPCGYYFTQVVELNNCTSTYNSAQIILIFVVSALLLAFTLIYFVLILKVVCQDYSS
jgi:cation transporter-like permease